MKNLRLDRFFRAIMICLSFFTILIGKNTPSIQAESSIPAPTPTTHAPDPLFLKIQSLMSDNGGCVLPCFWGFQPGEATATEIDEFLSNMGVHIDLYPVDEHTGHNVYWSFKPDGSLSLNFSIWDRDNSLRQISVIMTAPQVWLIDNVFDLSHVLNSLGTPTDVFILIAGPPLRYSLVVLYNDLGVMLRYRIYFEELPGMDIPLSLCPSTQEINDIHVWLQSPEDENLVEEHQPDLREDDRETRPFWPIDRMTGMDVEEFMQFFIDNPAGCIEALSLGELQDAGYQY